MKTTFFHGLSSLCLIVATFVATFVATLATSFAQTALPTSATLVATTPLATGKTELTYDIFVGDGTQQAHEVQLLLSYAGAQVAADNGAITVNYEVENWFGAAIKLVSIDQVNEVLSVNLSRISLGNVTIQGKALRVNIIIEENINGRGKPFVPTVAAAVAANHAAQSSLTASYSAATQTVNFSLNSDNAPTAFELHDASGRTVAAAKLNADDHSIQLPNLAEGVYFLTIETAGSRAVTKLSIVR